MSSNSFDAFNQKVSLIYEYNNKSPLFARVADNEIEKNNIDSAIKILTEGLTNHPDFSVAYFLLGKAHTIKGNYGQALKCIKKGSELIHSPKTFDYYLREIDAIKKQRQLFNVSRWAEASNENQIQQTQIQQAPVKQVKTSESIEETLNKLTAEIEGTSQVIKEAKQKIEENRVKEYSNNDFIVSETLAKIYITQGEFKEAISVYKKLKQKNPEKESYFDSKIAELKAKLSA
jgi:tetratricopeptide (TPR) repeat protein